MAWVLALEVALDSVVASVAVPAARSSPPPPCPRNPSDKGDRGPAALCGQPAQTWCLCFLHPHLHPPFLGLILPVSPQCQHMDSALLESGSFFLIWACDPAGMGEVSADSLPPMDRGESSQVPHLQDYQGHVSPPSPALSPTRSCVSLCIRTRLLHRWAATDPARSGREPPRTLSTLLLPFIHLRVNPQ